MDSLLTRTFKLFPPNYSSRLCIAGGAAVDVLKASDIDVYILNTTYDEQSVQSDLARIPGVQLRDLLANTAIQAESCPDGSPNTVLAEIPASGVAPAIQIIGAPVSTPELLLMGFDLSVHCVAYTPDGKRHTIDETTTPDRPIKVLTPVDPDSTLRRYRRFCLRYGIQPDPDELVKLCLMPDKVIDGNI